MAAGTGVGDGAVVVAVGAANVAVVVAVGVIVGGCAAAREPAVSRGTAMVARTTGAVASGRASARAAASTMTPIAIRAVMPPTGAAIRSLRRSADT